MPRGHKKETRSKLGGMTVAFLLGFVLIVIVLEIVLRLIGFSYSRLHIDTVGDDNSFQIACLGDSYTEGMGAPLGQSYPEQLQQLMDEKHSPGKIHVANLGSSGKNTSYLLNMLPGIIHKCKPDVIVFMAGSALVWNKKGCANISSSEDFWYHFKVYQLMKMIWLKLNNKSSEMEEMSKGGVVKIEKEKKHAGTLIKLEKAIEHDPGDERLYNALLYYYLQDNAPAKALKLLQQKKQRFGEGDSLGALFLGVALDQAGLRDSARAVLLRNYRQQPGNEAALFHLAEHHLRRGDYGKAYELYSLGLEKHPRSYQMIAGLQLVGQFLPDKQAQITELINRINKQGLRKIKNFYPPYMPDNFRINAEKRGFEKEIIEQCLVHDLNVLIALCRANDIELVLMTYPVLPHSMYYGAFMEEINGLIRREAQKNNIPLADHFATFNQLGADKPRYFQPIGIGDHCNARGYGKMAKDLYNLLDNHKLLPDN